MYFKLYKIALGYSLLMGMASGLWDAVKRYFPIDCLLFFPFVFSYFFSLFLLIVFIVIFPSLFIIYCFLPRFHFSSFFLFSSNFLTFPPYSFTSFLPHLSFPFLLFFFPSSSLLILPYSYLLFSYFFSFLFPFTSSTLLYLFSLHLSSISSPLFFFPSLSLLIPVSQYPYFSFIYFLSHLPSFLYLG